MSDLMTTIPVLTALVATLGAAVYAMILFLVWCLFVAAARADRERG